MPAVAVGSPPRPSALPITTTVSSAATSESVVIVGRPDRVVDLHERDVVVDRVPDDVRVVGVAAAAKLDLKVVGPGDHVVVGEHETGARDQHSGAGSHAVVGRRRDVHDGGLDHVGDRSEVDACAERFVDRRGALGVGCEQCAGRRRVGGEPTVTGAEADERARHEHEEDRDDRQPTLRLACRRLGWRNGRVPVQEAAVRLPVAGRPKRRTARFAFPLHLTDLSSGHHDRPQESRRSKL